MKEKRKTILLSILTILFGALAAIAGYYWYQGNYYVGTEDAKVTGDIVRVSPQIPGKLVEYPLEEGQYVETGQVLGRQEMMNMPDSSLEMAVLRAPVAGQVIKKTGVVGEVVAPGQVLAMIIDPKTLYVTANIDEDKLGRVKVGQAVDITLDTYPNEGFSGEINSIGNASTSTFSLLPSSSGGNFTKVVQKVPVKIIVKNLDRPMIVGTNAAIKIHVK